MRIHYVDPLFLLTEAEKLFDLGIWDKVRWSKDDEVEYTAIPSSIKR